MFGDIRDRIAGADVSEKGRVSDIGVERAINVRVGKFQRNIGPGQLCPCDKFDASDGHRVAIKRVAYLAVSARRSRALTQQIVVIA